MGLVRRNIFPLFGAGTTLALGIALGAGALQGDSGGSGAGSLEEANAKLTQQVAAVRGSSAFGESLAAAASASWLHGQLPGESVTLIVLPGVSDDRVDATSDAVKAAGGTVAITAHLADDLLDAGHKTYVSSVATSSLDGAGKVDGAKSKDPYEQLGSLLGRAYVAQPDRLDFDDIATKIDSELQGAKLVTVDGDPAQRGSLVLVLGSGAHGSDVGVQATSLIAAILVERLAAVSGGALLVTPPTGADAGGVIGTVRANGASGKRLSTINVTDGTVAQVSAVYALAASARGKGGNFGVDGSKTILPPRLANHAG
ncbi:MAG TPA: copper transporter [Nocardioidaceae bacterium]|nr:copper transporter [Nocardioidaceae bacterium]